MESCKSIPLVIPIKSFRHAKNRLADRLDAEARAELAQKMAETVIEAANPFRIFVACEDSEVKTWALDLGVQIISCEGLGLNGSVEKAAQELLQAGNKEMIVAHSDLPKASSFLSVLGDTQITIVPDRHQLGTNVIRIPLDKGFVFQYGKNSFQKHQDEARRLNLDFFILKEASLMLDIDLPEDLDLLDKVRN